MTRSLGSCYGISVRTWRGHVGRGTRRRPRRLDHDHDWRPGHGGPDCEGVVMIAAATLVEALGRGLPGDRLVVDPDVLAVISHDDAEWAPAGKAVAGVRARTEAEVQHVVRTCAEHGAPVVPRGA